MKKHFFLNNGFKIVPSLHKPANVTQCNCCAPSRFVSFSATAQQKIIGNVCLAFLKYRYQRKKGIYWNFCYFNYLVRTEYANIISVVDVIYESKLLVTQPGCEQKIYLKNCFQMKSLHTNTPLHYSVNFSNETLSIICYHSL